MYETFRGAVTQWIALQKGLKGWRGAGEEGEGGGETGKEEGTGQCGMSGPLSATHRRTVNGTCLASTGWLSCPEGKGHAWMIT